MANWGQSHFLQSLGWATLNSFWQMALLWCIYSGLAYLFNFSSRKKYQLSALAIATGFAWFVFTFLYYYGSSSVSTISFFNQPINESSKLLNIFLLSASLTYLGLLIFPSFRLFRNWQFVQRIKKQGLHKAELNYRLFVQKISGQMGIQQKVIVYVSELVRSPLTVGYLKPIILLPVAALNHLSTQQVEAILLHELSHIRRYDYLVNLMVSVINTLLYFNPFVKLFMKNMEVERENCCDQLVLQFGYDKVGYASALLTLEKLSIQHQALAIGATGKKYLLDRIEKIVGMEKKKRFKRNQFAGLLAALFCVIAFNSFLIIRETAKPQASLAYNDLANPLSLFNEDNLSGAYSITPDNQKSELWVATNNKTRPAQQNSDRTITVAAASAHPAEEALNEVTVPGETALVLQPVAYDEVDGSLTREQKEKVKTTVAATRKILSTMQWKEVENSIADAMSEQEKVKAKAEYERALDKTVDWQSLEQNIKATYQQLDWNRINTNLANGLTQVQLDSVERSYTAILGQLEKAKATCEEARIAQSPLPDQSVKELKQSTDELRRRLEVIKAIRSPKKVVRL
jgi:beta-lactamase regulating signal transducer with metallopeptidase domain